MNNNLLRARTGTLMDLQSRATVRLNLCDLTQVLPVFSLEGFGQVHEDILPRRHLIITALKL